MVDRIQAIGGIEATSDLDVPPLIAGWDLGKGEAQVLAHCYAQATAVALLDDLAARRCAAALSVRCVGTIGLVLIAKKRGWITHVAPVLKQLMECDMYISQDLMQAILQEADESPLA